MPKELATILLSANLMVLGGALSATPVSATPVSPTKCASDLSVKKGGVYELLSWKAISHGRAKSGIAPNEDKASC
jgi:hypothetical protein